MYKDRVTEDERSLHCQLITSSWCGLLAALTPLIDAATDESATENVLKAMQNYAALCGTLGRLKVKRKFEFFFLLSILFCFSSNRFANAT